MNVNEIKNGQIVRMKFGGHYENGKVLGTMGDYATVSFPGLAKQITTKIEDMEIVKEENNKNQNIEFSGHPGYEMEMFAEKYNLKRKSFYVELCGIPAGSYFQMTKRENLTVEAWQKFEKGKAMIEAMDEEDLKKYQKKPKICTVPGFKIGNEENKKDPDNERIELIEKLQNESKINEFRQNEEVMEEIKMEDMKPKSWIEAYKELIRSLSMEETFEFFNQVKIDAKRFEEMFDEVKRSII